MATRETLREAIGNHPRNVEQITREAQSYEYNALIGLKYWLRSAGTLLKQAEIYEREGDDERNYFFLFRHAHLLLTNLERHPDAKSPTTKQALTDAQREVRRNLTRLDELKPKIKNRYERYIQIVREREARSRAAAPGTRIPPETPDFDGGPLEPGHSRRLHANENKALAVQLARKEYSRRAAAQEAPQQTDRDELARRLQQIGARVNYGQSHTVENNSDTRSRQPSTAFHYPSVPNHQQLKEDFDIHVDQNSFSAAPTLPPGLPAKILSTNDIEPPGTPEKALNLASSQAGQRTDTTYTFRPAAYLENGAPLRTLFLPPTVRTTFLRLAHSNTLANLETCAFLAGTLISNALFVSKLIVPAQTATSDTCEMTNESQLFDFVDSQPDLMVVGWIHTHPKQTCFMSSRDLHTHSGYQMMLSESVAIVCAPSQGDTSHGGDWGVYRLTDPPGKMSILSCRKPGIFHPHEVDNIYTDALRPGHVVEAAGLEFEVVDLRDQ